MVVADTTSGTVAVRSLFAVGVAYGSILGCGNGDSSPGGGAQDGGALQAGGASGGGGSSQAGGGGAAGGGAAGGGAAGGSGGLAGGAGTGGASSGSAGQPSDDWGNTTTCAETVIDELSELPAGTFVDARDGRAYRTTQIGSQLWMAENLDYGTQVAGSSGQVDDGVVEKYCVDDCEAACAVLGGLYTWAEAMGLSSACNQDSCPGAVTDPHRGICPEGWHVPDGDEWDLLVTTVEAEVGQFYAGNALRSTQGWLPDPVLGGNGNGDDAYGMRVLPTGVFSSAYMAHGALGERSHFWIASASPGGVTPIRMLVSGQRNVASDSGTKTMGFSLRCIAD